jgi:F-type H+-transporting ATPase subunit b
MVRSMASITRKAASLLTSSALALPVMAMVAPGARAVGMPQLDFANPLVTGQVVWGGAIFLVLYVLLSRSALPRVDRVLTKRRQTIDNDLDIARRAKVDADAAVDELHQARRTAMAEAQANVEKVVEDARVAALHETQGMNARLATEIREAEARVAAARAEALGSLRQIADETARALIHQVAGTSVPTELLTRQVDEAATAHGF